MKFRLNQTFTGNRKLATDLNGNINIIYSELMRKFDTLSEHIKRLDNQVAENATAIKRETGHLPGRTDANPKRQVNVVLIRSRKRLTPNATEINHAKKPGEVEKTGESRSGPILLDNPDLGSEPSQEKERSNTGEAERVTINLDEEEEESEEDVEIDRQEGNDIDRPTTGNIDRQIGNNVDRHSTTAKPAVERVCRTLPSFPPSKSQTKRELDKAICKKAFDKITLEIPLSEAIKVSPSIKKYVKDIVSNSFPAAEHSVKMVSEEVSGIIQGETLVKRPDPDSFVLDCNIRNKIFPRSLSDLGSSVNLMPHSVAISLGYNEFKPTKITLVLADRSVKRT